MDFCKGHPAAGGLPHGGDRHLRFLADPRLPVFDDHHGAVRQAADALAGFLSFPGNPQRQGHPLRHRGAHGVRQGVQVQRPDAADGGGLLHRRIGGDHGAPAVPGCPHQPDIHILADAVVRIVHGNQVLILKIAQLFQPAAAFYKVPPERVLVVSDDVSLPLGKLRIRAGGSAGGHNGLKSIISRLGTDAFPRLKVGVGAPPNKDYDMADWVLSGFPNQDAVDIAEATARAADALEAILSEGIERAMNRFN